jgi:hypothetical protein
MALYIPHSIFRLAQLLYVRPETFGPYYVCRYQNFGGTCYVHRRRKYINLYLPNECSRLLLKLRYSFINLHGVTAMSLSVSILVFSSTYYSNTLKMDAAFFSEISVTI